MFPLPDLVVFPGVVQALHVFEPRYRKMTEDCLAADNLITMCLYRDAESELSDEKGPPPIFEHVCVCKIFAHNELEDGRHNLMVAGVKRAVIKRELSVDQPYRMAEVDLIEDEVTLNDDELSKLRGELLKKCEAAKMLSSLTQHMDIKKLLDQDIPLGLLVDLIAFVGQLDCRHRQELLELANVEIRCWKLIELIGSRQLDNAETPSRFPPDFSSN